MHGDGCFVADSYAFDDFFDQVSYSGAFSANVDSWLDGWSYLDCVMVSTAILSVVPPLEGVC